jgi:hypothetical protein
MSETAGFLKLEEMWLRCREPQAVCGCSWCGCPIYAGEEFAELDNAGAVCLECIEGLSGRELVEALSIGKIKTADTDRR